MTRVLLGFGFDLSFSKMYRVDLRSEKPLVDAGRADFRARAMSFTSGKSTILEVASHYQFSSCNVYSD